MPTLGPGSILAGYEILKPIGKGGMGYIWLARQVSIDRLVALKILAPKLVNQDPRFAERFIAEARAAGKLSHPHIIAVHDVGQADFETVHVHYFSMEYVNGSNFREIVERDGPLENDMLVNVMSSMADALSYAHDLGMIHRDIKPENIMLTTDHRVKLADFGLAMQVDNEDEVERDESGRVKVMGTPLYMSPEQARGRPLDSRSDLYSLGATLYYLLTGSAPYRRPNSRETMRAHVHDPVPDPGDVAACPKPWRDLCMQLMAKEPDDRFLNSNDLKIAVQRAGAGESIGNASRSRQSRQETEETEESDTAKKLPIGIGLAVVGIIVVATVAVLMMGGDSENPEQSPGQTAASGAESTVNQAPPPAADDRVQQAQQLIDNLPEDLAQAMNLLRGAQGLRNPLFTADDAALALLSSHEQQLAQELLAQQQAKRAANLKQQLEQIDALIQRESLAEAWRTLEAIPDNDRALAPDHVTQVVTQLTTAFDGVLEQASNDIALASAEPVIDIIVQQYKQSGLTGTHLERLEILAGDRKATLIAQATATAGATEQRKRELWERLLSGLAQERADWSTGRIADFDAFTRAAERDHARLADSRFSERVDRVLDLARAAQAADIAFATFINETQPEVTLQLSSGATPSFARDYAKGYIQLQVKRSGMTAKRSLNSADFDINRMLEAAIKNAQLEPVALHTFAFMWMWDLDGTHQFYESGLDQVTRAVVSKIDPDLRTVNAEYTFTDEQDFSAFDGKNLSLRNQAIVFSPQSLSPFTKDMFQQRAAEILSQISPEHMDSLRWKTSLVAPATFTAEVTLDQNAKVLIGLRQKTRSLQIYCDAFNKRSGLAWTGPQQTFRVGHTQRQQDQRLTKKMTITVTVDADGATELFVNDELFAGSTKHPLQASEPIDFVIQDIHFKDEEIGPVYLHSLRATGQHARK